MTLLALQDHAGNDLHSLSLNSYVVCGNALNAFSIEDYLLYISVCGNLNRCSFLWQSSDA